MKEPLINILIRTTKGRLPKLAKCLDSISQQTYRNYNVIIGADYGLPKTLLLLPNLSLGTYYYNDYCNILKEEVKDGYFFFLDDDDCLVDNTALDRIVSKLNDNGLICQMKRGNGKLKPTNERIEREIIESGQIGMPCLVLHSDHKELVDVPATSNGDFVWIKEVSKLVDLPFAKEVLVYSEKRGFGQ